MSQVEKAAISDIPKLADLEKNIFTSDIIYPRQFRYLLTKANGEIFKVEEFGDLVGYMVLLKRKKSKKLRIYSICVAPQARKKGIAGKLICHAEKYGRCQQLESLVLEVCEKNTKAIDLYKKVGFFQLKRKENYYEDGCSALQFMKDINGTEGHDSSSN